MKYLNNEWLPLNPNYPPLGQEIIGLWFGSNVRSAEVSIGKIVEYPNGILRFSTLDNTLIQEVPDYFILHPPLEQSTTIKLTGILHEVGPDDGPLFTPKSQ